MVINLKSSWFSFVFALVLLIPVAGCTPIGSSQNGNSANVMQDIRESNVIKAGWAPYAPYAELDPQTKKPKGYYIDVLEGVAKEAGFKVEWVETTWGNMVVDAKSGRFQVMAAPVFRTIPRATQVSFTRPIDYFGLSAVVSAKNQSIKTIEDLKSPGLAIAVTQGEVGQEYANRNLPDAKVRVFNTGDISLALNDVIEGRADVGIADAWTIRQFTAEHSGQVIDLFAAEPFNQVGAGWFVTPDQPELLEFLNTSIDWMISSKSVDEISQKYELGSKPVSE